MWLILMLYYLTDNPFWTFILRITDEFPKNGTLKNEDNLLKQGTTLLGTWTDSEIISSLYFVSYDSRVDFHAIIIGNIMFR
jgi:hypothetical protein